MMEERHYAFFQNRDCEYFPCHATKHPEDFNCLFCYCPRSGAAAAAISAIRRTGSRTAPAVCSRTGGKITTV